MTKKQHTTQSNDSAITMIAVCAGLLAASAVGISIELNGPAPRPKEYEKVSTNQAFYSTKPIQVEGNVKSYDIRTEKLFRKAELDMILTDNSGSEIKCESSGINLKLNPPHDFNRCDEEKTLEAYKALIRNEARDNLKVTAAGKMDGNTLKFYELTVNGTKYVLLEK